MHVQLSDPALGDNLTVRARVAGGASINPLEVGTPVTIIMDHGKAVVSGMGSGSITNVTNVEDGGGGGLTMPMVLPVIAPPALTGTQNDWAPSGITTTGIVNVNIGGASRTITGLAAAGFTEGQTFWLFVYGGSGFTLTLTHNDSGSVAGNRFSCPAGSSLVVRNNAGVQIFYLPTKFANAAFQVVAI